jgi:hypothetical protein
MSSIQQHNFLQEMRDSLPSTYAVTKENDSTEIAIILRAIDSELSICQDQINQSRDSTFYFSCRADALYANLGFIFDVTQESWQATEDYRNLLQGILKAYLARPSLEGIRAGLETFIGFKVELEERYKKNQALEQQEQHVRVENEIDIFTFDVRVVIPQTATVSLAQELTNVLKFITRVKPAHTFFYQSFVFEENFELLRNLKDRDWLRISWVLDEPVGDCEKAILNQHFFVLNRLVSHLNGREDILICSHFNCVLSDELVLFDINIRNESRIEFASDQTTRNLNNDYVEKILAVTTPDGMIEYEEFVHWRSDDRKGTIFTLEPSSDLLVSSIRIANTQLMSIFPEEGTIFAYRAPNDGEPKLSGFISTQWFPLVENIDFAIDYANGVFTRIATIDEGGIGSIAIQDLVRVDHVVSGGEDWQDDTDVGEDIQDDINEGEEIQDDVESGGDNSGTEYLRFRSGGVALVRYDSNAVDFIGHSGVVIETLNFSEKNDQVSAWMNVSGTVYSYFF